MKNINDLKNENTIENYISVLFHVRDKSHIEHLKTKSFAEHKALNEFYDQILELSDDFIETYQGQYGIIENYSIKNYDKSEIKLYLENFISVSRNYRNSLSDKQDSHLQNILDEIIALSYKTIYKLKYLK